MSDCPRCGTVFGCGMVDGDKAEPCWCTRFPILPVSARTPADAVSSARCYCPDCLRILIAAAGMSQHMEP